MVLRFFGAPFDEDALFMEGRPFIPGVRGACSFLDLATSCIQKLTPHSMASLGEWIGQLEQRMHRNKVVVAFANKIARMAWAVLTRPGNLYERVEPTKA